MSHNVRHLTPPFLQPVLFQSAHSDVIFECAFLVREVTEFHGLDDPIHDECGSKARPQTQEKTPAALVTSQRLHGSIIDDFYRVLEGGFEIEADPSFSEIVRLCNRHAPENRSWVADGYHVVCPVFGELLDIADHLFRRQSRSGRKLP